MDHETDTATLELGVKSAKVASYIGLTHVISIVVAGVALIVLARLLQPAEYGVYTLAYSVWALFSAINLAGIGQYLNKYIPVWIARKKKIELREDLGLGFVSLALMSIAVVLIGIALSGVISQYAFHSASYAGLIDLALAAVLFTQLGLLAYNALVGFKDGSASAINYDIGAIATAATSIGLVILGYGVYGAIAGLLVGGVIWLVSGFFFITRHSAISIAPSGFGKRAKRMLTFSLPLAGASMISTAVSNFSVLLLGAFSSAALLGSFGVAYKIGIIASLTAGFINGALVPMFSSAIENRHPKEQIRKLYNYSVYFGAAIGAPVAIYLIVMAGSLVRSVFPAYTSSLLYTPSITVAMLVGMISAYASSLLISMGDIKRVVKYTVIVSIVQMVLLITLVPLINAYGVILGVYLVGNLLADYLYMNHMQKRLGIRTEMRGVYKIVAASLVLGAALSVVALAPINDTLRLAIGIVVMALLYPATLGLIKAFGKGERELLVAIGRSSGLFGRAISMVVSYVSFFSGDAV